ncbi:MAG: hypothetical protein JJU31_10170 [Wenzhouxiangella sp.]|nr:hypothetical protein [Wenzhouxiangella sp.]MCH8477201.1 sulfotransferase [Wenzhouxiangella sp.]TVR98830.1 MAG: hypothetical protein EA418_00795 [Wenzhouxiangellaceae bacterium]
MNPVSIQRSPEPAPAQRAVFVIGAGRSGTSTVARALAALGVEMGQDFKRASRKNPTGFFEDAELLELSKAVRNRIGIRADSVRLIEADELQGQVMSDLRDKARQIIQRKFLSASIWGFKYGRTLRILPFWEPVLESMNIEPSFVIALRNPLSVARSRARLDPRRGHQAVSDLEWLVSIVPYLGRTRRYRLCVVDYDQLMDQPVAELSRLARELDLPQELARQEQIEAYARQFLDRGLRHTRFSEADLDQAPDLNPVVRDAYQLLLKLAAGSLPAGDESFWQAWQSIEQRVDELAPMLSLIDAREQERRRMLLNPLGPLQAISLLKPWLRR